MRAERIIRCNEDPLLDWSYFHTLYVAADRPTELSGLAYALDDCDYLDIDIAEQRRIAIDAIQEFLSPELQQQRASERAAAAERWKQLNVIQLNDWPYNFNSFTRKTLLRQRLADRVRDARFFLVLLPLSWGLGAWVFGVLPMFLFALASVVFIPVFAYWAEYRRMKRERRDMLLRMSVPEDQI